MIELIKMKKVFIGSRKPIVLIHTDFIYEKLIILLKNELKLINPLPFEFTNTEGMLIKEKYRYSYPINDIFKNIESLLLIKKFATEVIPIFLKEFKNEIFDSSYKINNLENLRYCLRVRVIEDKEGYSLQPHKDGADTIFSFILQLDSNNTKTALYQTGRLIKINGNFSEKIDDNKRQIASILSKLCPDEKIYYGESQFRKDIGFWTDKKFFQYKKNNNWIGLQEFNEELIDVNHYDIYAICNSLTNIFSSSKLKEANELNYHGVRPITQKSRKLLIMDLIAQPTSNDVLVMKGVNKDKNSYFLIYSPEKCSELTGLLS